jgi:hypothetical protein
MLVFWYFPDKHSLWDLYLQILCRGSTGIAVVCLIHTKQWKPIGFQIASSEWQLLLLI